MFFFPGGPDPAPSRSRPPSGKKCWTFCVNVGSDPASRFENVACIEMYYVMYVKGSSTYDVTVLGGGGAVICDALLNFREVPKEKTWHRGGVWKVNFYRDIICGWPLRLGWYWYWSVFFIFLFNDFGHNTIGSQSSRRGSQRFPFGSLISLLGLKQFRSFSLTAKHNIWENWEIKGKGCPFQNGFKPFCKYSTHTLCYKNLW